MTAAEPQSTDADLAAALLAVDPAGLGGVRLRGGADPLRQGWLDGFRALLPVAAPWRRLPVGAPDGSVLGGLDLAATLSAGRPIIGRGLLAEADGGVVLLPMAERLSPGLAAKLAAVIDTGEVVTERDGVANRTPTQIAIVALDEAADDEDERLPTALSDRLAFDLDTRADRRGPGRLPAATRVETARALLPFVDAPDEAADLLCSTALALGIDGLRPPLLALRAARAAAALAGRTEVGRPDIELAARLVLAPRATRIPAPPSEEPPPEKEAQPPDQPPPDDPPPADPPPDDLSAEADPPDGPTPEDVVLAAAAAAIPPGLLLRLKAGLGQRRAAAQGRAGALQQGGGRGRPAGIRRGEPKRGLRLNVIETLRAAAPWQPLRRASPDERVAVRKDDFRVTRLKRKTQTATLFVVDASGSAAFQRLAEAKGAVELLLGDCYVRRDRVALLSFRGAGAELLLAPTRSLVRAKRSLAGLPGGGGTPLAAGLAAAADLAQALARRGETPTLVLLTDGRANVASDGSHGRRKAADDALAQARRLRSDQVRALVIDTSPWPEPAAKTLALEMAATYLALPRADAATLSDAVRAARPA